MELPARLAAQARRPAAKVALREKQFGIWQEVSWEDYAAHVRAVSLGLVPLGLRRGDTRGGHLRQPAGLALRRAGGAGARRDPARRLRRQPARAGAAHPRAQRGARRARRGPGAGRQGPRRPGRAAAARSGSSWTTCAGWRTTASRCCQPRGASSAAGRELDAQEPGRYEALLDGARPDDVALLAYTSGTTGTRPRRRCSATETCSRWRRALPRSIASARPTTSSRSCRSPGWASSS